MNPRQNAMSRSLAMFEELGYDTAMVFARRQGGAWQRVRLSHVTNDGINGFALLLHQRGLFQPEGLPALPERKRRPWLLRWLNRVRQYFACLGQFRRQSRRWAPRASRKGESFAEVSFTREETARLRAEARAEGVSLNVLLLHRLERAVQPLLEPASPHPSAWIVPAHLYEDWDGLLDGGVKTTVMELLIRDGDAPAALQAQLTTAIADEAYWGAWLGTIINDLLPRRLGRRILRDTVARKMRVGTFSNLGSWKGGEQDPADGWAVTPPVHPGQPLGCGAIEYNGKLGLGLRADGSLGLDDGQLADLGAAWRAALLGGSTPTASTMAGSSETK